MHALRALETYAFGEVRTSRRRFAIGVLVLLVLTVICHAPATLLGVRDVCLHPGQRAIATAFMLPTSLLLVRFAAQRLHDMDAPRWPALALLPALFIEPAYDAGVLR